MSLMQNASEEEREGVAAIQFLLGLTNDKEPEWVSLQHWRSFYPHERAMTLDAYRAMKEEMDAKEKEERGVQAPPVAPDGGSGSEGSGGVGSMVGP